MPESAEEYGYTVADYDYFHMPEKDGNMLTVTVTAEAGDSGGMVFQSADSGATWEYKGSLSDFSSPDIHI